MILTMHQVCCDGEDCDVAYAAELNETLSQAGVKRGAELPGLPPAHWTAGYIDRRKRKRRGAC